MFVCLSGIIWCFPPKKISSNFYFAGIEGSSFIADDDMLFQYFIPPLIFAVCLVVSTSSYDKEIGVFIINKANEGNEAVYNYEIVPFSLFICARRMLLSKVIFAIYRFTLTLE